jgi:hypothetical protein
MAGKETAKGQEEPQAQAEAAPVIFADVAPEPQAKLKAVVVAGGNSVPKADYVVVVEAATIKMPTEDTPFERTVKKSHYPTGANVYLRYDPDVKFPADAPEVLTMGRDVEQLYFRGFTRAIGFLNVGPAHPAFAGANLAYQRGATEIEIVGLTDAEKEKLQPYIDDLPNAAEPALVAVTLT